MGIEWFNRNVEDWFYLCKFAKLCKSGYTDNDAINLGGGFKLLSCEKIILKVIGIF